MIECLDTHREAFKSLVLQHLRGLPFDEWQRLRSFAADRSRYADKQDRADLAATPEQLIDAVLSESSISVAETLVPPFLKRTIEIGTIASQPVLYVNGHGIYLWGLEPKLGLTLSVWVTHPAYPPDW